MSKQFSKKSPRKKTAGKMALRFLGAFMIYEVIFCMVLLLAMIFVEASGLNRIPAYESLRPVLMILLYIALLVGSLAGCGYLAYRFMLRPLEYLDDVADAAKALAHPDETPVVLPDALEEIQEDLNQVRLASIASAKAAKEAEARKDDLLVYLAHDLKNALSQSVFKADSGRAGYFPGTGEQVYRDCPGQDPAPGRADQ